MQIVERTDLDVELSDKTLTPDRKQSHTVVGWWAEFVRWSNDLEHVLAVQYGFGLGEDLLVCAENVDVGAADEREAGFVTVDVEVDERVCDAREKLAALGVEERFLLVVEHGVLLADADQASDD